MPQRLRDLYLMTATNDDGGGGGDPAPSDEGGDSGDTDYPKGVQIKDMTPEQEAAWWKHHCRKNENALKNSVSQKKFDELQAELDEAKKQSLSADEREIESRIQAAREEARNETRAAYAPRLVREAIRATTAGRVSADQLNDHLEFVDLSKFLTPEGEVDTEKVNAYSAGLQPSRDDGPNGWRLPPTGQDRDAPRGQKHSVSSAKEEHRARLREKST